MNRTTTVALLLIGGGLLLLGSRSGGQVEDATSDFNWSADALMDNISTLYARAADAVTPDTTPPDQAQANVTAWLATIKQSEGGDYTTCYGYRHTIQDLSDHPTVTGEWPGEKLSDSMCAAAGFGPGCKSTAAGAYQIIKPTWLKLRDSLGLPDFSPASQDAAAMELTRQRGALAAVKAGDLATAVARCRNEWASLPGNYARQGQRSIDQLTAWFAGAGGQAVTA